MVLYAIAVVNGFLEVDVDKDLVVKERIVHWDLFVLCCDCIPRLNEVRLRRMSSLPVMTMAQVDKLDWDA